MKRAKFVSVKTASFIDQYVLCSARAIDVPRLAACTSQIDHFVVNRGRYDAKILRCEAGIDAYCLNIVQPSNVSEVGPRGLWHVVNYIMMSS
jgi:hypothetical protein